MKSIFNIALISIILSGFVFAGQAVKLSAETEILLPEQFSEGRNLVNDRLQVSLTRSGKWQQFCQKNGRWAVIWNEASKTPHRAVGDAIKIEGFASLTGHNIEAAARSFLEANRYALGVDPAQIKFNRASFVNNRWYVSFKQVYRGLDVLQSEVELRVSASGKVMALGADFYTGINIPLQPKVDLLRIPAKVVEGLQFNQEKDKISVGEKLLILPVKLGEKVDFKLVYKAEVKTQNPVGNYLVYIDARSGEIVWRQNRVFYQEVKGHVSGEVHAELPDDQVVERNFANQTFNIGGAVISDSLGMFKVDLSDTTNLSARFKGPWADVRRKDIPVAFYNQTVIPGDSITIFWDGSNSHIAERTSFYHLNIAHDYLTKLDTGFTFVNYRIPCNININNPCQAWFDGNAINFAEAGGGCINAATSPSTVYHEYGHAINDRLYKQEGVTVGMVNPATHEGMADVLATFIEDQPIFARGFWGPGTFSRSLDNSNRYPDNLTGQQHNDGLILGGAFWDLRKLIGLDTAAHLAHFARYGLADDPNTAVAFSEWYVAVLVADDDDGDLGNGTPNFKAINKAFNKHGIGSSLFKIFSIKHIPLSGKEEGLENYTVDLEFSTAYIGGGEADSVLLVYSTDDFQSEKIVLTGEINPGQYQTHIPVQNAGTLVKYYFKIFDPANGLVVYPQRSPQAAHFSFKVGAYTPMVTDNFEKESGWKVGGTFDNATSGIWERGVPEATFNGWGKIQPGSDHSDFGSKCFVTGRLAGQNNYDYDVDGGKTTLYSPIYDLSEIQEPVVRYYRWFKNNGGPNPDKDYWRVDISNDAGNTWKIVERTRVSDMDWHKVNFKVANFVGQTSQVQIRFSATDNNPASIVEALIDDFEISGLQVVDKIEPNNTGQPLRFALHQNYPNPFNPSTRITYELKTASYVKLIVYDALGRKIKILSDAKQASGKYTVNFNATNLSSGIYYYKLKTTSGFERTRKLILLK